jgi:hypothetical protein
MMGLGAVLAAALPAHAEVRFEANAGQWTPQVRFVARQGHATWFVTDRAATVALRSGRDNAAVTFTLAGAQPSSPVGEAELAAKSNFFIGDRSTWRTGVASYARVRAKDQVPGVDVVWYAGTNGLEYDLEVAAGVDARSLAFDIAGARGLHVARGGALEIATAAGMLVEQPPRVVQNGRELAARYRIDHGRVRFAVDGYDPAAAVVIDPVVVYSTYVGGTGADSAAAIAVDAAGNAYITGQTSSTDFPHTTGAFGGSSDAYVTKLAPDGATAVYSTYIGGTGGDGGTGIAVDASGNAFVTGTAGAGFPTTAAALQTTIHGSEDAFVAELGPAGDALVYATYLGGSTAVDYATAIAVDGAGNAYVTGRTDSANFTTTAGAFLRTLCSTECTFVSKIAPGGGSLVYSTFLGSADASLAFGIAVDATGNAYVAGRVAVTVAGAGRFSTTAGAFQTTAAIGTHGFITKLAATGASLVYSSYLASTGANHDDSANAVAIDAAGNAYVAGQTDSNTFPKTTGAYQTASAGSSDGFITMVNPTGTALVYSTFLGGAGGDTATGIAVAASGDAFVVGQTTSTNFPTTVDAPQRTYGGGPYDAFVARLDPAGQTLVWGTYLGGSLFDQGYAIAVSAKGGVYATGQTSGGFSTTSGAFQTAASGGSDAFVTKLVSGLRGDGCDRVQDCLAGSCVDGVCCDTACSDQCQACDVAGSVGTCTPVSGTPHGTRPACASSACTCDGTATAQCTNNGAACDIAVCVDDHTSHSPDGSTNDCTPYNCDATGACATACTTVDDCVAPNVCDPNGKCIALPDQMNDGCGCRAAPSRWSLMWIGIVAFVVLRKRRRT